MIRVCVVDGCRFVSLDKDHDLCIKHWRRLNETQRRTLIQARDAYKGILAHTILFLEKDNGRDVLVPDSSTVC